MEKKIFTFKFEGWEADVAFCCRASSYSEAFSLFHEAVRLFGTQGGARAGRLVCSIAPPPVSSDDAALTTYAASFRVR